MESKKLEELMFLTKNEEPKNVPIAGKGRKLEPISSGGVSTNSSNAITNINSHLERDSRESGNNQSKSNFFNNNNKMEVSIKATVCFSNDEGLSGSNRNKKIEFNPNINLNSNIMSINMNNNNNGKKGKLEKIPEMKEKLNTEREEEEEY